MEFKKIALKTCSPQGWCFSWLPSIWKLNCTFARATVFISFWSQRWALKTVLSLCNGFLYLKSMLHTCKAEVLERNCQNRLSI